MNNTDLLRIADTVHDLANLLASIANTLEPQQTKPEPKQPQPQPQPQLQQPEPEKGQEPTGMDFPEFRLRVSEYAKAGKSAEVKALFATKGINKLSDLPPKDYETFLKELAES